ncbi:GH92 family glycosyl hydrolase, partial [candidate division KSB1 bacterium]|nr:GH92 family glycosyl hydrolase [candidate division KSB1 bacterium]
GAVMPWGMVLLGPDTYPSSLTGNGNWAHSGYNYLDGQVRGFSHLRITGSGGGGNPSDRQWLVWTLPGIGQPELQPGKCYTSMDKTSEQARAGYYSVRLDSLDIRVELTAGVHSGLHRYFFPDSKDAHLLINAGRQIQSTMKIVSKTELTGSLQLGSTLFYYIKLNKPFHHFAVWGDTVYENRKELSGSNSGAILRFNTRADEPILLKIGFSVVSEQGAKKNLKEEMPDWDFKGAVARAQNAWQDVLGKVEVQGEEEYKTIFYTHLYHSYITPNNITDVDGYSSGYDGEIHKLDHTQYDGYAFWDDFRKYSLLTLTEPVVYKDIIHSIRDIYKYDWKRPVYLNCRYEHMLAVAVDGRQKGLDDGDLRELYKGIRDEITEYRFVLGNPVRLQRYRKTAELGYVQLRPDYTMERSYDAWCVAQIAKELGEEADYQEFMRRAGFYKNVWDSTAVCWRGEEDDIYGFFRARDEHGNWLEFPHDPRVIDEKHVYEGSMWMWRWWVLHDVEGLIQLIGGREKFVHDLNYFFRYTLYNMGNQPGLHTPFLFIHAGAPWLTQKYVRAILTEPVRQYYGTHEFYDEPYYGRVFKATPDGFIRESDDDYGCMASWYVMSAMGIFQVCPGHPSYQLTAPIFPSVVLNLDKALYGGRKFTILAHGLSDKNIYIQSATLNGKPYDKAWITHEDIVRGGTLEFQMGPEPNKEWASDPSAAPPSMTAVQ